MNIAMPSLPLLATYITILIITQKIMLGRFQELMVYSKAILAFLSLLP
jgi:hypothetical protein